MRKFIFIASFAIAVSGCSSDADSVSMPHVTGPAPCEQGAGRNTCLGIGDVSGGTSLFYKDGNGWGITNDDFRGMLAGALVNRGLFSSNPSTATYRVNVEIVSLVEPFTLHDYVINSDVKYTVFSGNAPDPIFQDEIKSSDRESTRLSQALGPVAAFPFTTVSDVISVRQSAYQNSVAKNIEEMLVDFGKSSPTVGPVLPNTGTSSGGAPGGG